MGKISEALKRVSEQRQAQLNMQKRALKDELSKKVKNNTKSEKSSTTAKNDNKQPTLKDRINSLNCCPGKTGPFLLTHCPPTVITMRGTYWQSGKRSSFLTHSILLGKLFF